MSLHAQHSISSAFCMYGSELLGGLQPPPPLDPPLASSARSSTFKSQGPNFLSFFSGPILCVPNTFQHFLVFFSA